MEDALECPSYLPPPLLPPLPVLSSSCLPLPEELASFDRFPSRLWPLLLLECLPPPFPPLDLSLDRSWDLSAPPRSLSPETLSAASFSSFSLSCKNSLWRSFSSSSMALAKWGWKPIPARPMPGSPCSPINGLPSPGRPARPVKGRPAMPILEKLPISPAAPGKEDMAAMEAADMDPYPISLPAIPAICECRRPASRGLRPRLDGFKMRLSIDFGRMPWGM